MITHNSSTFSTVTHLSGEAIRIPINKRSLSFKFSTYFWKIADCKSYLLTPWSRVLFKKIISSRLVKKFPTFYGTRRFITAVTHTCHLSLYSPDCKFAVSKCLPIPGNGLQYNPLNAESNPICHLLALLGGATTVVVSRLRVKYPTRTRLCW